MLKKVLKEKFDRDVNKVVDSRSDLSDTQKNATKQLFDAGYDRGVNSGVCIGYVKGMSALAGTAILGAAATAITAYIASKS